MSEDARDAEMHRCYEAAVQDPETAVRDLAALASRLGLPGRVLGEDFAGTAAVSRRWCLEGSHGRRAVAVEHDAGTVANALAARGLDLRVADVLQVHDPCELIHVGNFSVGYHHEREELLRYLRHVRGRLPRGGAVVLEIYGGASAWGSGVARREVACGSGRLHYTWEQRHADVLSAMVTDVLHLELVREDGSRRTMREAFTYRLRLWSPSELADALTEVGFRGVRFFDRRPPVSGLRELLVGEDLGEGFVLWAVGVV